MALNNDGVAVARSKDVRRNAMEEYMLTEESIAAFLSSMSAAGSSEATIQAYKKAISGLAEFIGADWRLSPERLKKWRDHLVLESGYSNATVQSKLSAVNSFLKYIGCKDWAVERPVSESHARVELSKEEYWRLLQAAKALEDEQIYYMIKTFANTGIGVSNLRYITVEAVRRGYSEWRHKGRIMRARILEPLKSELLDYASKNGKSEVIFSWRNGKPLDRYAIWKRIQNLASDARVDVNKVNPRCLSRLYTTRQKLISEEFFDLCERSYTQMVEKENETMGWEQNA